MTETPTINTLHELVERLEDEIRQMQKELARKQAIQFLYLIDQRKTDYGHGKTHMDTMLLLKYGWLEWGEGVQRYILTDAGREVLRQWYD